MSDLIIIGAGPGGYPTAVYAASCGLTVTIIERAELGGTCLNSGCIPTKTLCRNAEALRDVAEAATYGIDVPSYSFDLAKAIDRKETVISQLRQGVETLLSQPGITLVRGEATLKDANTVTVNGQDYTARHIIIATGSRAKLLPIPGIDLTGVVTSTELLNTRSLPRRLAIVGAGVIGMEMASCFSRFGSEVTVIEFLKECLPMIDSDIAKRLRKQIQATFFMQSGVEKIERTADGALAVTFAKKGKAQTIEADMVLVATGRAANSDGLNLEAVGVATNRGAITVDDDCRTTIPTIFAIGDVNARCMLAHAATMQGRHVVNVILGVDDDIRLSVMPSAVFTLPEAASVGRSEDECRAQGIACTVSKAFYRANGKALAMNEAEGLLKLVADAATGRLIGCHVYGAHAADIVQEVSALMCRDTTIAQLRDMVHIHPTLSEVLHSAAL